MAKKNTISDLVFDDKNFNKGSEFGTSLMDKSLSKFGAGRSVLIDKNNRLIAGNKTTEKFGELGGQNVLIVDTDKDTLVAVRRNDIDLDTPEGREFALADNATAKANIVWDAEVMEAEVGEAVCEEWGVGNSLYSKGMDENNMNEDDLDFLEQFDPVGNSAGLQRVVFIFDGKEEAESWLNKVDPNLPMVKRNMAWQVNLSTQSI